MSADPLNDVLSYIGGGKASDATLAASRLANKTLWKMYNQTRQDEMPLIQAGQYAAGQLTNLLQPGGSLYDTSKYDVGNYNESDYYKWLTQKGSNAITAAGAAAGNLGSGNLGTALTEYGQNMAGAGYSDWYTKQTNNDTMLYNRLMGLISPSQNALTTSANAGYNTAATTGSNLINSTNLSNAYKMSGIAALNQSSNMGNIGNAIMNALNTYNQNNAYYNQLQGGGGGGYGGYDFGFGNQGYDWGSAGGWEDAGWSGMMA